MITGNLTWIRPANAEDATLLRDWWRQKELMRHVGFPDGIETNVEALQKNLTYPPVTQGYFIICDKATGVPIGEVTYHNFQEDNHSVSFGIKIGELSYQGKGYAKDALIAFINYLFEALNIHRIEIDTLESNSRARRLYMSLGFNQVGVKREAWLDPYKKYRNVVVYDLLKPEWKLNVK